MSFLEAMASVFCGDRNIDKAIERNSWLLKLIADKCMAQRYVKK